MKLLNALVSAVLLGSGLTVLPDGLEFTQTQEHLTSTKNRKSGPNPNEYALLLCLLQLPPDLRFLYLYSYYCRHKSAYSKRIRTVSPE